MHEDLIDCQAVKPGRKSRFAPKTADFSKELYEDLLSEIFGLRNVAGHSQAQRINATIMALVKLLESCHVALSGLLPQLIVCRLRCLGFGCGHVLVCSGKLGRNFTTSGLCGTIFTPFASFKGAALFLRTIRVGMRKSAAPLKLAKGVKIVPHRPEVVKFLPSFRPVRHDF